GTPTPPPVPRAAAPAAAGQRSAATLVPRESPGLPPTPATAGQVRKAPPRRVLEPPPPGPSPGPAAVVELEPPPLPPRVGLGPDQWLYIFGGRPLGPLAFDDLVDLVLTSIPEDTMVWGAGTSRWTPANLVPEITEHIPPPLPTVGLAREEDFPDFNTVPEMLRTALIADEEASLRCEAARRRRIPVEAGADPGAAHPRAAPADAILGPREGHGRAGGPGKCLGYRGLAWPDRGLRRARRAPDLQPGRADRDLLGPRERGLGRREDRRLRLPGRAAHRRHRPGAHGPGGGLRIPGLESRPVQVRAGRSRERRALRPERRAPAPRGLPTCGRIPPGRRSGGREPPSSSRIPQVAS